MYKRQVQRRPHIAGTARDDRRHVEEVQRGGKLPPLRGELGTHCICELGVTMARPDLHQGHRVGLTGSDDVLHRLGYFFGPIDEAMIALKDQEPTRRQQILAAKVTNTGRRVAGW